MIDYQNSRAEDFSIRVQAEDVQAANDRVLFPVRVVHKSGQAAFSRTFHLSLEFWHALRQTPGWQEALIRILKSRAREEIEKRRRAQPLAVSDRLALLDRPEEFLDS